MKSVKLFPDIHKKEVVAVIAYTNDDNNSVKANFILQATSGNKKAEALKPLSMQKDLKENGTISITYSMGNSPLLWDEFNP